MALAIVTPPALEPVSLAEAKQDARIYVNDDDPIVAAYLIAGRQYAEDYTGRRFVTQTWDYFADQFPGCTIELPIGPIQSVTSVKYTDSSGIEQTLIEGTDYDVDNRSLVTRIRPTYAKRWPIVRHQTMNAISIRVVAGYGSNPGDTPEQIRQAIKLHVQSYYEADPAKVKLIEDARDNLLRPLRVVYA